MPLYCLALVLFNTVCTNTTAGPRPRCTAHVYLCPAVLRRCRCGYDEHCLVVLWELWRGSHGPLLTAPWEPGSQIDLSWKHQGSNTFQESREIPMEEPWKPHGSPKWKQHGSTIWHMKPPPWIRHGSTMGSLESYHENCPSMGNAMGTAMGLRWSCHKVP